MTDRKGAVCPTHQTYYETVCPWCEPLPEPIPFARREDIERVQRAWWEKIYHLYGGINSVVRGDNPKDLEDDLC